MRKIKIGTIFNTHGLRGELKIKSLSDFNTERFAVGNELYIEGVDDSYIIATFREHKGAVLISFKNYQDINLVESLKGKTVYINLEETEGSDEEGHYFFELNGCDVFDQNGTLLGVVEDILLTGAHPILRVNKTILIPYVPAFIKQVDVDKKRIDVEVIEGLI